MQKSQQNLLVAIAGVAVLASASIGHAEFVSDHIDVQAHHPVLARQACIQVDSDGSFACTDAGNYESTCAVATCPADYTLTGGGGSCSAGDSKVKSLVPRLRTGEFTIACERQGVDPEAVAICCKF